jgi:2-methylcitrate dehydratase PrpD
MGVAFAKGKIAIEDFLPEMLSDPKVLEIADKVKYTFDPALEGTISPGVVKVRTLTGESFVKR